MSTEREQCWIISTTEVDEMPPGVDMGILQQRHHAYIEQLDSDGLLVAHGAARDENGERFGPGFIVIRAATRAQAEAVARREPYILSGTRVLKLIPWQMQRARGNKP